MRDRFLLDLGIPDTEDPAPRRDFVRDNFIGFLRAGGRFSWSDWATMSEWTSEVAVESGHVVKMDELRALAALTVAEANVPRGTTQVDVKESRQDDRIRASIEKALGAACAPQGAAVE